MLLALRHFYIEVETLIDGVGKLVAHRILKSERPFEEVQRRFAVLPDV